MNTHIRGGYPHYSFGGGNFPTQVGVIPIDLQMQTLVISFPHTSGGYPIQSAKFNEKKDFPHASGGYPSTRIYLERVDKPLSWCIILL